MIITKSEPFTKEEIAELRECGDPVNTLQSIADLSLDLRRISQFIQRGSNAAVDRFISEAIKHCRGIDKSSVPPYLRTILSKVEAALLKKDINRLAEDCLTFGTILQNYFVKSR